MALMVQLSAVLFPLGQNCFQNAYCCPMIRKTNLNPNRHLLPAQGVQSPELQGDSEAFLGDEMLPTSRMVEELFATSLPGQHAEELT